MSDSSYWPLRADPLLTEQAAADILELFRALRA
jgi:hypothetical protein